MHNAKDAQKCSNLSLALRETLQREFGHILTGMRQKIQHADPKTRAELQAQVDGATEGILVVYLFAMFDFYTSTKVRKNWLSDEEKEKLLAYRHIRNSVAHMYEGKRAKGNNPNKKSPDEKAFEKLHDAGEFKNLVWDKANETLDLSKAQCAHDLHTYMSSLAQKLTGRLANNPTPSTVNWSAY